MKEGIELMTSAGGVRIEGVRIRVGKEIIDLWFNGNKIHAIAPGWDADFEMDPATRSVTPAPSSSQNQNAFLKPKEECAK